MKRIFILSPAKTTGKRAELLFSERASFELAQRVRTQSGVPIGEVFSFLSGLYFRGKLAYATHFARPPAGLAGCYVITSDAGLMRCGEPVTLDRLRQFSQSTIDPTEPRYRRLLEIAAHGVCSKLSAKAQVVLLGSIATGKYVDILHEGFGKRLVFPTEFVGRGDMSRGGLLLRAVQAGAELEYISLNPAPASGRRNSSRSSGGPDLLTLAPPMMLPIKPPYLPMEALSVGAIPVGDQWQYESKWDGFRCLAFRDGAKIELQSKAAKPLARYFPELVEALKQLKATRFVLDGEIVIPLDKSFSFDMLLQRIHPAASRIRKLSAEFPAKLIVFDLLVGAQGEKLSGLPLSGRRKALEGFAKKFISKKSLLALSPAATDQRTIEKWVKKAGNALDGVIAKRLDLPYRTGERDAMQKIKTLKSADCVVGGFRYASKRPVVGSLLLGLYDEAGLLNHVGFIATGQTLGTAELTKKLEKLVSPPGFTGNAPGGPSRWSTDRSTEWKPLKPKLVVEVRYDHFTGGRFRHGTKFLRWRPDKKPEQCTIEQVSRESGLPLLLI